MGLTGLIFVAFALAWLVYLVPLMLNRKTNGLYDDVVSDEPITPSVTIVRRGVPLDVAVEAPVVVSTPLNRRAALRELDLVDARASVRRRIVLGVLLVAGIVLGLLVYLGRVPWWSIGIPVGLLVLFVGVARVTVVQMRKSLDARAAAIRSLGQVEETVSIAVLGAGDDVVNEETVDLTAPIQAVSSLWDPIPITKPTYVSKPLAPRTVRTIDLSAPVAAVNGGIPVTADSPEPPVAEGRGDRAVNE